MRREHKKKDSIYLYPHGQTYPICQQNFRGCRPTFYHNPTIIFIVFACIHLLIGIVAICLTHDAKEYKVRYDDKCNLSDDKPTGETEIHFGNPVIEGNLFFYFELHDYYQTYFLYSTKYTIRELRMFDNYPDGCRPGDNGSISDVCIMIAKSFFRDHYEFVNASFNETGISWKYDKGKLTNRTNKTSKLINEHYSVWMRIAAHPYFRKLYAKTTVGVPLDLHVKVKCLYSYKYFKGARHLVLLKPSGLGGRSWVLAIFNFILFAFICAFIIVFEVSRFMKEKKKKKKLIRKRRLNAICEVESKYYDDVEYP